MALVASMMIRPVQSGTFATNPCTASNGTARATNSASSASSTSVGMMWGPSCCCSGFTAAEPFEVATATSRPTRANCWASAEPTAPDPMMAYFITFPSALFQLLWCGIFERSSQRLKAAVDGQAGASEVTGIGSDQKRDRSRDVGCGADAAENRQGAHSLRQLAARRHHVRFDRARLNHMVDLNC